MNMDHMNGFTKCSDRLAPQLTTTLNKRTSYT